MNSKGLLTILTLVVLAILTWQLRWVIMVLLGAIVIAVAIDVLIVNLQKYVYLPRQICLILILIFLSSVGSFLFIKLAPELLDQIKELGEIIPTLNLKINAIISNQPRLNDLQASLSEQFNWEKIQPIGSQLLGLAGGAVNILLQLVLMILLAILLVLDPKSHREMIIMISPKPYREEINKLFHQCRIALGGWLTGMTISATSVFALTWLGLHFLKVPLALLSALVCGVLTFIPTIGPSAASVLPIAISLLISPALMVEVLILRIVLQNLEALILTPILLRKTVNLLPTFALTSQLSLGVLLGLPGVLLALPLAVMLQVIIKRIIVIQVMDRWV